VSHKRIVQAQAVPPDFYKKIKILNAQDNELSNTNMKNQIISSTPEDYHQIINNFDCDVLQEIYYIRVMFEPPLTPLTPSRRIRARKEIIKIMESKNWEENELSYFMYLLKHYGCYDS
jgi:hypothetical protein